ncbi:hypothetical protein BT63DRAFT_455678 [Microthyrium microscopicum]|uniref:Uncharacterized protein n=1 Tax=Microthyrium microscopicum TaxID=703497 RepID=A0A6A6UC30_9PEZI|nr:hypothetical protein BT63DRAFT_455678 [Microthyrium microscopicum]
MALLLRRISSTPVLASSAPYRTFSSARILFAQQTPPSSQSTSSPPTPGRGLPPTPPVAPRAKTQPKSPLTVWPILVILVGGAFAFRQLVQERAGKGSTPPPSTIHP